MTAPNPAQTIVDGPVQDPYIHARLTIQCAEGIPESFINYSTESTTFIRASSCALFHYYYYPRFLFSIVASSIYHIRRDACRTIHGPSHEVPYTSAVFSDIIFQRIRSKAHHSQHLIIMLRVCRE